MIKVKVMGQKAKPATLPRPVRGQTMITLAEGKLLDICKSINNCS